jgi:DNA topoisomerase-1
MGKIGSVGTAARQAALLAENGAKAAKAAQLRYVHGDGGSFRRIHRAGKTIYLDTEGRRIRQRAILERIEQLAVPPAWTDVWICPDPRGHLQAWGRDTRGRKQYRYHARWREVRDAAKYTRLLGFALALPRIRSRVARDLRQSGLTREKVLATVVRLLESTMIRVGNEEYAKTNGSFGLTTLRRRHVDVTASRLRFEFRGKSQRQHTIDVTDRRLARIVRRCQELHGQELFKYVAGDGSRQIIDSEAVNAYLREICGQDFTAKDFRTWAGTVHAFTLLRISPPPATERMAKATVRIATAQVAMRLGNTPAVCRTCYLHPAVIEAYMAGTLSTRRRKPYLPTDREAGNRLSLAERQTVEVLERAVARGRQLRVPSTAAPGPASEPGAA